MIGLSSIIANISAAALVSLSPDLPSSYQMDIKLDTSNNKIIASENIEFMNPTSDTLDQICFHLYPNAFRDTASVFCRENSQIRSEVASSNTSELRISNLTIDSLTIDSSSIRELGTLLYVTLPTKLPPLKSILISLDFELKISRTLMRIGYNDLGNYVLSHWHPILCGYQQGVLQDFEYHSNGEFFSNFSSYNVRLDLPSGFAVGSTGELTEVSQDSNRTIWQAQADTVIDFAFVCGPAFEVIESDTLGIKLRYLLEKRHAKYAAFTDAMTKLSLMYNSEKFYKYPYKTLTVVDFQSGASGLELPGMVIISFPGTKLFSFGKTILAQTIAHEITHEWFYATVASNEAIEPWLDEGITSYVTERLLSSGGDTLSQVSILGYKLSFPVLERLGAIMSKGEYPIDLKSWDYPDEMSYATAVYYRSNLVLETLESLLGRDKFDIFLKTYANNFRFKHPNKDGFLNNVAIYAGPEMPRFGNQFIDGTARLDYAVKSVKYKSIQNSDSTKKYEITITVAREYEGILPQKIRLGLEDGTKLDTLWEDNDLKTTELKFVTSSRPQYAELVNQYALDENVANNSLTLNSFGSRLISFEWDIVFGMELLLSIIL
jgi:hypothetical protein